VPTSLIFPFYRGIFALARRANGQLNRPTQQVYYRQALLILD
jgi:hypothetical protein